MELLASFRCGATGQLGKLRSPSLRPSGPKPRDQCWRRGDTSVLGLQTSVLGSSKLTGLAYSEPYGFLSPETKLLNLCVKSGLGGKAPASLRNSALYFFKKIPIK